MSPCKKTFCSLLVFLLSTASTCYTQPQHDSSYYNPQRARIAGIGVGATYVASMTGLYYLWYADYPSARFHFFNDDFEWKRMDKFGHVGSAYYVSKWCQNIYEWTGTSNKRSTLFGTGTAYLFLSTIELFDAYSSNWGFSVPDMISNTAGAGLFLGQQLLWKEQRMQVKFSYHSTKFATYRPVVLGENNVERLFKDYNGQTYWLSINIHSFLREESKFPKWLNIAVGYGADGMVTAADQVFQIKQQIFYEQDRIQQFYIAPDIDLTKIKWNSKFLRALSQTFGFIKFPLPALEWNKNDKYRMHGFYF